MSCSRSTSWNKCRGMRRKSRSTARCTADRIRRGQGSSPRRKMTASWLLFASGGRASDRPAAGCSSHSSGCGCTSYPSCCDSIPRASLRSPSSPSWRGGSGWFPRAQPGRRRPADSRRSRSRWRRSREAEALALALSASSEDSFLAAFLAELRERVPTSKDELQQLKRRVARSRGLAGIPSDSEVLGWLPPAFREELVDLLRVKPARTASGVAVVTVMTAPYACPHGVCTFCPGGPRVGTPQSYLGTEPAAQRASAHRYHPGSQIVARLRSLQEIGHPTDKVDLIVLGGTFTSLDREYQESFVKGCLDAMNGFVSDSIVAAQAANETAAARCIGLTIETKPDCFLESEVDPCLALGTMHV